MTNLKLPPQSLVGSMESHYSGQGMLTLILMEWGQGYFEIEKNVSVMRLISYHLGEAGQPYWYFLLQNWGERSLHQHIEHLMHWKIPCEIDKQTEHTWLPNRT